MPSPAEDDSYATLRPDQPVRGEKPDVLSDEDLRTLRGVDTAKATSSDAEFDTAQRPTDEAKRPAGNPVAGNRPSETVSRSVVAGTEFGDYEIIEEIARGGMGLVVKARQKKLNRIVAVKMILTGKLADDGDVKRFYTEAEASADLDHPHIVPIYEIGKVDGLHFYSMRFVDGPSLADKVKDGPLRVDEAARLSQQISAAVGYAHERGILHRDLKPANILIDAADEPLITDFGLAKRLDDDQGLTGTGQVIGTPGFMPPEQALGNVRAISSASDIYSLGAILYCLLTGRAPFQAASIMETLSQVINNEPVAPRQLNPAVPVDLETICLKCLSKEPKQRYLTAQDLADDLGRYLDGLPVIARPVGGLRRFGRWCRRNPVIAALSVTAVASLIAGTIVSTIFGIAAADRAREAEAHLQESLRQQARAEANFKLARKAVDEYFTQVSENTLLNQPGMQSLQQELLGQALRYYEQFLVEHADDPEIQDDLAGANFRVGLINETVETDAKKAISPLQKALEIQEKLVQQTPTNVSRQAALADTLTALGRIQFRNEGPKKSLGILQRAAEIRQNLAANDSASDYQRVIANSLMNVGLVYMNLGQFSEARQQFDQAQERRLKLLEKSRDVQVLRDFGMGHYNLGNLALSDESSDENAAFESFSAAIEVFAEVVEAEPQDFSNQARLALCYRILGDLQSGRDAVTDALKSYGMASDTLEKLVALNPDVTKYREQLANLEMNRGHLLVATGDFSVANERFTAALVLWSDLKTDEGNLLAQRSYAVAVRELALIQIDRGEVAPGRVKLAEAESILRSLAAQNPNDQDIRFDLEDTVALRKELDEKQEK